MSLVRAKKHLGQHFLTDKNIAVKIVESLRPADKYKQVFYFIICLEENTQDTILLTAGLGTATLSYFLLEHAYYLNHLRPVIQHFE